jgi:hypothetical protein
VSLLNAAICTTTYLERQKCYGPGKKILFKKQLFDLEVKCQGPTKVITVHDTPPDGHTKYHWPLSKDKNVMAQTRKYYLKNNYLTLRSNVKVPRRSLRYVTHCLMVMHPHTKYHWPILKDKNVMARTRKYYLNFFYLTSRSNIMIPRRSLRYVTHRLMVMHPHTKYNWPIWKDKKVMVRTSFTEKKQKKWKRK